MAIARVTGKALADNLERTANLAIDTSTFFVDVANNRVGIGSNTPTVTLDVAGSSNIANISIAGNSISAEGNLDLSGSNVNLGANSAVILTGGTSGQILSTDGSGSLSWVDSANVDAIGNLTVTDTTISTTNAGSDIVLETTGNGTVNIDTTTALQIAVGNTAQRPATPSTGDLRFNTTETAVEVYNGTGWEIVGQDTTTITSQTFSGDNSTIAFTLSASATTASVIVSINGTVQAPTTAYSVSGTTLTFTEAPASGDAIEVRQITATTTVTSITNGTGNAITVDTNGIAQFSTIHSLQLPTYNVSEANALTNTSAGQIIYVSNGNGGAPCLAVYNGSNWQQVRFDGTISAA